MPKRPTKRKITAKKVSRKISKLRSEGKPQNQAVAAAINIVKRGAKKRRK